MAHPHHDRALVGFEHFFRYFALVQDEPHAREALDLLALACVRVAQDEELAGAGFGAIGHVGRRQHPLALERIQIEGLAIERGQLKLRGGRHRVLRLDERAVDNAAFGAKLRVEINHDRGNDGREAEQEDDDARRNRAGLLRGCLACGGLGAGGIGACSVLSQSFPSLARCVWPRAGYFAAWVLRRQARSATPSPAITAMPAKANHCIA